MGSLDRTARPRWLWGLMLAAWAGVVLCGCATTEAEQVARRISKDMVSQKELWTREGQHSARQYRVAPPDVIAIDVRDVPELTGTQRVRPDGRIAVGIFGEVHVSGLTPLEISGKLEEFLEPYYHDIEVAVNVVGYKSKQVYLFGQVKGRTGVVAYTGQETVLEVIARAGGITHLAAPRHVRVIRPNLFEGNEPVRYEVDLTEIVLEGNHRSNILIQPNDQIYVPPTPLGAVAIFINRLWFPLGPAATAVRGADELIEPFDQFGQKG